MGYFAALAVLVGIGCGGYPHEGPDTPVLAYAILLFGAGIALGRQRPGGAGTGGVPPQRCLFNASLGIIAALHFALPRCAAAGFGVIGGEALAWTGVGLFAVGITLRVWAMTVLGRFFSYHLTVQSGHALVRAGPYRFVRHPAYLAFLLSLAGFGFAFRSVAGIVLPLAWFPVVVWTIRHEESVLAGSFGAAFEEYRRGTKGLVPFVW